MPRGLAIGASALAGTLLLSALFLAGLAAKKFPQGKVVWTVRAPQAPGAYPVAVGFAYGTEKASPHGRVTNPSGAVLPRGGGLGPSGHILFSKVQTISVR